jgi:hypothetical protein
MNFPGKRLVGKFINAAIRHPMATASFSLAVLTMPLAIANPPHARPSAADCRQHALPECRPEYPPALKTFFPYMPIMATTLGIFFGTLSLGGTMPGEISRRPGTGDSRKNAQPALPGTGQT